MLKSSKQFIKEAAHKNSELYKLLKNFANLQWVDAMNDVWKSASLCSHAKEYRFSCKVVSFMQGFHQIFLAYGQNSQYHYLLILDGYLKQPTPPIKWLFSQVILHSEN